MGGDALALEHVEHREVVASLALPRSEGPRVLDEQAAGAGLEPEVLRRDLDHGWIDFDHIGPDPATSQLAR